MYIGESTIEGHCGGRAMGNITQIIIQSRIRLAEQIWVSETENRHSKTHKVISKQTSYDNLIPRPRGPENSSWCRRTRWPKHNLLEFHICKFLNPSFSGLINRKTQSVVSESKWWSRGVARERNNLKKRL